MAHCNGRLFDGSACNNLTYACASCDTRGCHGDGCDSQLFTGMTCDCGSDLTNGLPKPRGARVTVAA